ncbi:glycosyltransferase [Paludibaculum fermentans]|uniref:glycosyltransferase n=1 Tax=Paludibaculum fermentans TaxID=1473598 RepID=UPI003EB848E9
MRIALITPLFPLPQEPYRGKPVLETAFALSAHAELHAFCPISRYPPLKFLQPKTFEAKLPGPDYNPRGIPTIYRAYSTLPVIGRLWNGWSSRRSVAAEVRAWNPDVILSYWLYPEAFGAVQLGRQLGKPVVVGSRGSDLLRIKDGWTRARVAWTVRHADGVLTVSSELAAIARGLGAAPERVHMVTNGCDTALFTPSEQAAARTRLGLPANARIVLYVGHLLATKGVLDLAEAAARLSASQPDLLLVYVGEGPDAGLLRQRLESLGLTARTRLAGPAAPAGVAEWLAASDVLSLPSYSEGCPNVVLEALSCGRPVVASTVGAIPDLIDQDSGILVPPGDPVKLGTALEESLRRSWDAGQIASRHRRSWADVARETLQVCEIALSSSPRSPVAY